MTLFPLHLSKVLTDIQVNSTLRHSLIDATPSLHLPYLLLLFLPFCFLSSTSLCWRAYTRMYLCVRVYVCTRVSPQLQQQSSNCIALCGTGGGSASDSLLRQDIPVAISSRLPCDSVVSTFTQHSEGPTDTTQGIYNKMVTHNSVLKSSDFFFFIASCITKAAFSWFLGHAEVQKQRSRSIKARDLCCHQNE